MKMIRAFRKKYIDKNVYLYRCNGHGCKRYSMMLHSETCVICGEKNQFYDESLKVPDSVKDVVFVDIMEIAEVLGAPVEMMPIPAPEIDY